MRAIRVGILLVLVGGCAGLPAMPGMEAAPAPTSAFEIEQEIYDRINDYRGSVDDPPLALEATLVRLAREHSAAMAAGSRPFGHDGFDRRLAEARATLRVTAMSENVATNNYPTTEVAAQVVEGWLGSPGHLRNLRGAYELTGVGVAIAPSGDTFVTQIYAAR